MEIKINANSGSNQQTMTLRSLIATRQQECQTAIEVILAENLFNVTEESSVKNYCTIVQQR